MSQAVITLAFEQWKAKQAATDEAVTLDEFVFANVPGLDIEAPIDREEAMPPAAQIVHRQAVSRKGVVNDNAVVHSVVLGADVGDFTFNWVGLINKASGTLAMIVHAPEQQKLKTKEGQQGNVLTRSFLMEYNGAQAETQINTPAETWQIDFTARMAGMDERQRLENLDIYGAGAFFDNGYLVAKSGTQYYVTKGTGYVAGLRSVLAANQNIVIAAKPVKVWLDVCWSGSLTSVWTVQSKITVAANLADYVQSGVQHYVFAIASIDTAGNITDLRPKGTLGDQQGDKAFLRKDANLSDLTNPTEARKSLELKTGAVTDVTTSARDTTANRLLKVGDYGIGRTVGTVTTGIDFKSYVFIQGEHLFVNMSACTNIPPGLSATDYYYIFVHGLRDMDGATQLLVTKYSNIAEVYMAHGTGAAGNRTWTTNRFYNTGYKPSASDVGAVPTSITVNGHALTGNVNVTSQDIFEGQIVGIGANQNLNNYQTAGIYAQTANANTSIALNYPETNAGALVILRAAGVTQIYYVYNSSRVWTRSKYADGAWTPWAREYNTLNKPSSADVGALALGGGTITGGVTTLASTGAGSYASQYAVGAPFYQQYAITVGSGGSYVPMIKQRLTNNGKWAYAISTGTLMSESGPTWVVQFSGSSDATPDKLLTFDYSGNLRAPGSMTPGDYSNFDARYQAKGNYTPAGQAYTKEESNTRYQLKNTASKATNGWHKDTSTGVITQWGTAAGGGDDQYYTVNTPIAFPSAFTSLQVFPIYPGAITGAHTLTTHGKINSTSQFGYGVCDGSSGSVNAQGVYWIAKGY
jgi:Tail fiber protein.